MLCRADKSPFWRGWQHHRAPFDEIEYHQARGLPVGVIPWSLRASGLDVDWGNPSDFATAYPESTEGGRRVSILKWPEGALLNLG